MNNHRHNFIKNLLSKTTPTTKNTPKESPNIKNPIFGQQVERKAHHNHNFFEAEREPGFYNQDTQRLPYGSMPNYNSLRQVLTPPSKITPDKLATQMNRFYGQEKEVTRITKSQKTSVDKSALMTLEQKREYRAKQSKMRLNMIKEKSRRQAKEQGALREFKSRITFSKRAMQAKIQHQVRVKTEKRQKLIQKVQQQQKDKQDSVTTLSQENDKPDSQKTESTIEEMLRVGDNFLLPFQFKILLVKMEFLEKILFDFYVRGQRCSLETINETSRRIFQTEITAQDLGYIQGTMQNFYQFEWLMPDEFSQRNKKPQLLISINYPAFNNTNGSSNVPSSKIFLSQKSCRVLKELNIKRKNAFKNRLTEIAKQREASLRNNLPSTRQVYEKYATTRLSILKFTPLPPLPEKKTVKSHF